MRIARETNERNVERQTRITNNKTKTEEWERKYQATQERRKRLEDIRIKKE